MKGWEKLKVELDMEGREHWAKAAGTGKNRNQWGLTTWDMSVGPSAQRGQTGPAESVCDQSSH